MEKGERRVNVNLSISEFKRLKILSVETFVPMDTIIRIAVLKHLSEFGPAGTVGEEPLGECR
jgi:hypothetical protein